VGAAKYAAELYFKATGIILLITEEKAK